MVSQHALRQTPPVNRMTDRCKNITLPQTSFAGGKDLGPDYSTMVASSELKTELSLVMVTNWS